MNCAFYKSHSLESASAEQFPGFEEYTAPNVWPAEEDIPGFRDDTQELIKLIIDTAVLVARACDRFAEKEVPGYKEGYLERMVEESETSKARLLHYFPSEAKANGANASVNGDSITNGTGHTKAAPSNSLEAEKENDIDDSWCTTHLDHGCLTGLTSAMFLDESQSTISEESLEELPSSPDPSSGLYILSRNKQIHKISIPRNALAFQTGEALELITGGRFKAVPHFVKGVDPLHVDGESSIARNTLAVFTQPNLDEVVDLKTGLTFGEFARGVVKRNTADEK